jgi:glycosyltransferase involved in cell wall biosynthesis
MTPAPTSPNHPVVSDKATIRMLFFPRESFPTDRVRINMLFGRMLLGRGHAIDLVMQAADSSIKVGRLDWRRRSVWVGPTDDRHGLLHRLRRLVLGMTHDLAWIWRARRAQYDCILVSDKYLIAAIALAIAHMRGLKFMFWMTFPLHTARVTTSRERLNRYPRLNLLRGHFETFLLRHWIVPRSDHIFVQSQRMAQDFRALGADERSLTPIVTGVDLDDLEPRDNRPASPALRPLTIVYLGTLSRQRRLEILVDTLAELRRRGIFAKLLFVGDGEYPEDREVIQRRAIGLNLAEQVEITGFLPRREALRLAASADIGVSPFYPSPILDVASPTKLIEYLALGLPAVANSHPDQSLVLRESRAGVCVPWGAKYFARAIHWLALRSAEERAAMGLRGRHWVESHRSYSIIADDFERACLDVLRSA